ncbi:MAG: tetratricopeptide repeat protein [Bryobacteraceae bacterium]|nr:tetratricopeptide repeat protein [Bryobacteraceae bacterium]
MTAAGKCAALAVAAVFAAAVWAQEGGGGGQAPPGGGGAPPGGTVSPGPSPTIPTPSIPSRERQQIPQLGEQQPFPEMRRPVFLSGKVLLEDGTPPPEPVVIERVCNGVVRPEGYTDSKGRFSIELGRNALMMADASVGSAADPGFGGTGGFGTQRGSMTNLGGPMGGLSERDLIGCELRASLPGYQSQVVMLSGRRLFDNPDVGTIVLRRLGNVEGTTISMTSLSAPKEARKAYEKGREAAGKKKWADAQKQLEKAVQLHPEYAAAWFELGRTLESQNHVAQAREAYSKALAADPKFINPYLQLAGIAARERNWEEVAAVTDRILQLNPFDFPGAYFYNAVANFNLRKLDAAEKSAKEALKLDTQNRFPKVNHLLGLILAQKHQFASAVTHLRNYLALAPNAPDAETVKQQLAEVERFAAQTASPPNPEP